MTRCIKREVRRKQMRLSRARMMAAVAGADVVITNPTHFAVALRYQAGRGHAPQVVAKGADEVALRIRAEAIKHGVPIVEDRPLAQAIYAACEIDAYVPQGALRRRGPGPRLRLHPAGRGEVVGQGPPAPDQRPGGLTAPDGPDRRAAGQRTPVALGSLVAVGDDSGMLVDGGGQAFGHRRLARRDRRRLELHQGCLGGAAQRVELLVEGVQDVDVAGLAHGADGVPQRGVQGGAQRRGGGEGLADAVGVAKDRADRVELGAPLLHLDGGGPSTTAAPATPRRLRRRPSTRP